ncbi:MAG: helix-hairpin-helix domain-containing protein [Mariniblastus sp.]|nr:helix-hairpin-helix domain-containing protein [Mariniblastus sp.]
MAMDLAAIARDLKKPVEQIETALKLLDDGNTIPFVTRFRKDETGGLDEAALQLIQQRAAKIRAIDERRTFVIKSIESQGKLDEPLVESIRAATSARELEDLYLPFKPKKQNLASQAKQGGLEPLAMELLESETAEIDLATRATEFVRVDKGLPSVDDVIKGVGYILAEKFSDRGDVRSLLRQWIWENGKLVSCMHGRLETDDQQESTNKTRVDKDELPASESSNETSAVAVEEQGEGEVSGDVSQPLPTHDSQEKPSDADPTSTEVAAGTEQAIPEPVETTDPATSETEKSEAATDDPATETEPAAAAEDTDSVRPENANEPTDDSPALPSTEAGPGQGELKEGSPTETVAKVQKKKKKKKKKKAVDDPFKDYHDFQTPLKKIPHYRVLAINRGERASKLKVKIKFDDEKLNALANEKLVPADHPNQEFMKACLKDAINRLIMPSLEREIRRELTDRAERQAVTVFAHNLKNLLLQAPVQNQRILAIDPGYKRGCSVVAMDTCGKVLASDHIFVVGNQQRKTSSAEKITELVKQHNIDLIAIGNGAACREAEKMVSDVIANHFAEQNLKYAMVNEAGASFYSTSEIGREELPDVSPAVRSAISIGRRLMDPLSELVKISPANIGVGMYQHDVKAKHLSDSLDEVVTLCVNRVGVNVNTASPSLLRYVSGLNQLTARRVFEYREEHGPFKNRSELKKVTGFGDATFIQSAGFLRIRDGDQPLDSTAIHPESYPLVETLIHQVDATLTEIFPKPKESTEIDQMTTVETTEPADSGNQANAVSDNDPGQGDPGAVTETDAAPTHTPDTEAPADTNSAEVPEVVPSHDETSAATSETQSSVEPKKNTRQLATPRLSSEEVNRRKEIVRALRELDAQKLATDNQVGKMLVKDILQVLCRPGYDPRNKINRPVFRKGILTFDELKPELQLDAQVVNVVDFGVFVDIGLGTSCLVHVSQLANRYIQDPHEDFAVGDVLQVWVTEVDTSQRRVKLTAIRPGSKRKPSGKRGPNRGPTGSQGQGGGRPRPKQRRERQAGGKTRFRKSHEKTRRRPPKPVKPITDEMLRGNAPMRSFSDLSQFYDKKSETPKSNDTEEKNE